MCVLVTNEAITSVCGRPRLDVQQVSQFLEDLHLVAVVFTVILNVALSFTQLTHHRLLLLLLNLEVLVEGLHVGHQALVLFRNVLCFPLDSLLECLKDVRLHVVRVELRLALFVLLELRAHFFGDLLLFDLHLVDDGVVGLLFSSIFVLDVSHLLAQRSQFLYSWRKLSFLFFHILFNLLNKLGQFLQ